MCGSVLLLCHLRYGPPALRRRMLPSRHRVAVSRSVYCEAYTDKVTRVANMVSGGYSH